MYSQQRLTPAAQFALLLVFIGGAIVIIATIGSIIAGSILHVPSDKLPDALLKPENVELNRSLQVISSFLLFAVPAILVNYLRGGEGTTVERIGFNENINIKLVALVILIVYVGFFLSGALGELNKMIPLTKHLQEYFDQAEENYSTQVQAITNRNTINDYIYSLAIIALAPAIFEEMFFRGALQQVFISWTGKPFWGILIAGIFFSASHGLFFGFLPRLFLGMMLGYLFYYSKNLWLSVIAHFFNNAFAITQVYFLSRAGKLNADSLNDTYPWIYVFPSLAVIIFLFYLYKKESNKLLASNVQIANEHERLV